MLSTWLVAVGNADVRPMAGIWADYDRAHAEQNGQQAAIDTFAIIRWAELDTWQLSVVRP